MGRRLRIALLVAGVLLAAGALAAPASAEDVGLENTLSQSDSPDAVAVETRLSIPDSTVELEITLPEGASVTGTEGFERIDERTYEWTETTDEPVVRYEYQGTVRGARGDREGVRFVVAEGWALVRTPSVRVGWTVRSTGPDPDSDLDRRNTVAGEGVASTHMAYLGPYEEYTGSAAGQEFRLIVPEAADLREDPDEILAALEAASRRLEIGERTPGVFVVAAPTAEHTWGPAGVQRGDSGDMWVRDAERLGTVRNTWVHEYVHTRQRYGTLDGREGTTDATRWTIEGMADYYATLLAYENGHVGYERFRDRLSAAEEYDDVVLADRETWAGTVADYDRGALVFAHLDRRLRAAAGTTLDRVVADLNAAGEPITQRRFLDAIEAAGGAEIRDEAERYTETTATPPLPTRSEHVAAFGGPDVRYAVAGTAVAGPYREAPIGEPRLVVGESLELEVAAENVGDDGPFEAELLVDGEAVASESGDLKGGESTTLRFSHRFGAAGTYEVAIGGERLSVVVSEPAAVAVRELDVPGTVRPGESARIAAVVEAAADRPAAGNVTITVDGETVASERVRIGEGTATVETTVTFDAPGEYVVAAGDRSATVLVEDGETGEREGSDGTAAPGAVEDQPGFGPAVAAAALSVAALLASGRRLG